MCTVSLIRPLVPVSTDWPVADPLLMRLVVNRDEQRLRAAALPPVIVATAAGRAVMPIDPQGGGTWVAVTEHGLVFTLLNVYGPAGCEDGELTRGAIIPRLLDCASPAEALERLQTMDLGPFRPWRLLVADAGHLVDVVHRGEGRLRYMKSPLPVRVMATSSSRRQVEAERARQEAFRTIVAPVDERTQDAFHGVRDESDGALGVVMHRPDARTVSRTTIEVGYSRIILRYQALDDAGRGPVTMVTLARGVLRQGAA